MQKSELCDQAELKYARMDLNHHRTLIRGVLCRLSYRRIT